MKIFGNFVDLENRYKEIINENRLIKGELADLRKNMKASSISSRGGVFSE